MGIVQEAVALVAALSPIQLAGAVFALFVGVMQLLDSVHPVLHMLIVLLDVLPARLPHRALPRRPAWIEKIPSCRTIWTR